MAINGNERFSNLVNQLAKALDIPKLDADEEGNYELVFDGKYNVKIGQISSKFCSLESTIARLGSSESENQATLAQLLKMNVLQLPNCQTRLTVDESGKEVVLFEQAKVAELSFDEFHDRIENFVNRVEWWSINQDDRGTRDFAAAMPVTMLRP